MLQNCNYCTIIVEKINLTIPINWDWFNPTFNLSNSQRWEWRCFPEDWPPPGSSLVYSFGISWCRQCHQFKAAAGSLITDCSLWWPLSGDLVTSFWWREGICYQSLASSAGLTITAPRCQLLSGALPVTCPPSSLSDRYQTFGSWHSSCYSSDTVPLPFLQIIAVPLPFYVKPRV